MRSSLPEPSALSELQSSRRLLILACSATKRRDVRLLPALDRYAGPSFRVLRRWLHDHPMRATMLDVYVLSAEFGLFPAAQPIPDYDRRMTAVRAEELRPQVAVALRYVVSATSYAAVGVIMGRRYRLALAGNELLLRPAPVFLSQEGAGIGAQLAALKQWLEA
ncbi:MAG: hypothetical protein RLZZ387_4923 [Chloroflexota bacterium]|jgi:hypothetical protein